MTREQKIERQMAQYNPAVPVETRREWAEMKVAEQERHDARNAEYRRWLSTPAGMQWMMS